VIVEYPPLKAHVTEPTKVLVKLAGTLTCCCATHQKEDSDAYEKVADAFAVSRNVQIRPLHVSRLGGQFRSPDLHKRKSLRLFYCTSFRPESPRDILDIPGKKDCEISSWYSNAVGMTFLAFKSACFHKKPIALSFAAGAPALLVRNSHREVRRSFFMRCFRL
jgi:hypothetical protein